MKEIALQDILAKALRFLTDAQFLLEKNRFESSVDRAYYAMYHSIQVLLFVRNIQTRSHQQTHRAFNRELILTNELRSDLGKILKKTFKKSQRALYDYDKMERAEATEAFTDAETFFCATVQYLIANKHLQ